MPLWVFYNLLLQLINSQDQLNWTCSLASWLGGGHACDWYCMLPACWCVWSFVCLFVVYGLTTLSDTRYCTKQTQDTVLHQVCSMQPPVAYKDCPWYGQTANIHKSHSLKQKTNKNLRCGNRKGLLGRNDQTHHRMGPKTMESIPPSKRNTQADIQLRTRQTNHQQETDGCIQIKHNPEHQPSRMSSKSTAYVPPKTASTPTKANTQTCSYLDFNQFLIRRITRNICLRLRIKQIQILTCREQDIR